ncbi:Bug family tripartite tricarboxylate transporter substrate binding protein [Polynucleobacter kasalickyi]|uniref:Tripartite-type tricarboxylate transporter, receptor component TctC n=1 Tax=Polynucleobacter kasalickyi TaxID=1938817 RepID=A0A1W1Y2J2_9BURK|nr:tripartite tricarboxylate transporter substrate binding protein [Polynucleobacter kasalickyi]SMC30345.1 Tripartite-type tricarboxylate transporter, receptor component TctC [Polynucleobacter kasalickyi]
MFSNYVKNSLACLIGIVGLSAMSVQAQSNYPTRPIKMIVPYATGGGSDILARAIGAKLQVLWGQGIAIENRPGASGNIGTEAVVHAPSDGYTLVMQNSTMVGSAAISGKLNYDPEKDLTPIMVLGLTPMSIVASESSKIKNLKDLVAYSKANPNSLNYGSCGIGSPQHILMELVKFETGVKANHIVYKGCAPAVTDVVGGQVQLAVVSANLVSQYVKTGRLQSVGISTAKRYNLMPQSLTFAEQGLKSIDDSIWYALMGPANLPPEIVKKWQTEVTKILADPAVRENLSNAGVEAYDGNPYDLGNLIKTDLAKFGKLVKSANIKAE